MWNRSHGAKTAQSRTSKESFVLVIATGKTRQTEPEMNSPKIKDQRIFTSWNGKGGCEPSVLASWSYQK